MIRALALFLVFTAAPVLAAERSYAIGSFDRIRVEGPFDVRLTTAASPRAIAEGAAQPTDDLDIRVEGATLIVRAGANGWAEQRRAGVPMMPVVRVATQMVRSVTLIGGGRLAIAGPLRAQRIDLQLTGSGALEVAGLDADQLNATLLGPGSIRLAGRGARVRLLTSGAGTIDAAPLIAGDLLVRLDGTGEIKATARFTAEVTTTGIGGVTVYGTPACTVKAQAGGPVSCGKLPTP